MKEKQYEWKCVRNSKHNHKFFQHMIDGKPCGLAIADQSGYYPHETDDGVLWVDMSKPIIMGENKEYNIRITCAVRKELYLEDEDSVCSLSLAEALWLLGEFDLPLTIEPQHSNSYVMKLIERF